MKSVSKKFAVVCGFIVLGVFWGVLIVEPIKSNNWDNLQNSWVTYLIASVIISILISLVMYLTAKHGLKFVSLGFVVLGVLIFLASAKGALVSILIAKYLNDAFDVNMLASSIGVIAFGFALFRIAKDENK